MMSYSEYYGCGSTKARVYASLDFLAVILEETFTPADKTLIARGEAPGSRTFAAVSSGLTPVARWPGRPSRTLGLPE
jgi:hypothetical protein